MKSFKDLNFSPEVSRAISQMGFEIPSEIQSQAVPILIADPTDFIGLAATGTGKTAAFGLPLIEKINPELRYIQAIILCPTRELALQVSGEIDQIGQYKEIKTLPVYGGAGYGDQIRGLKSGHQIVVGTPGRIVDHIKRGTLKIKNVNFVILDEADKMVSMGFKEELETILEATDRDKSNTWLFSATMEPEVRRVADTYLTQPKFVQVNRTEVLAAGVEQLYYPSRESEKPEMICKLIEAADEFYGVIFCQTKSLVMDLSNYLANRGYKVDSLHGDKNQSERERTMKAFREKKISVLVCTDIASRGLDVKNITHVVNYSLPRELDVYVHRIGRTARSGSSGIAISLVTPSQRGILGRIEKITRSRIQEGRLPSRRDVAQKKVSKILTPFNEQKDFIRATELLSSDWKKAIEGMPGEEIVGRFLCILNPKTFNAPERSKPLRSEGLTDSRERSTNERRSGNRNGPTRKKQTHGQGRRLRTPKDGPSKLQGVNKSRKPTNQRVFL